MAYLKDGEHKLVYYAIDNVDNAETIDENNIFNFYLDSKLPEANASITGDQFKGKYLYVSERSFIKLDANDSKSSVNEINYGINTTILKKKYSKPFKPLKKYGVQSIYFLAVDKVRNVGRKQKINIFF